MRIRVYYEDTDCGGIVYHTNYIKYCERARSELFFAQGTPPSHATCGFVVSALEAKFLGFAKLGDIPHRFVPWNRTEELAMPLITGKWPTAIFSEKPALKRNNCPCRKVLS